MRRNYELFFWLIAAAIAFALFLFARQATAAAPKLGHVVRVSQYAHVFNGKPYSCVEVDYTRGVMVECVLAAAAKQKPKTSPAKGAA